MAPTHSATSFFLRLLGLSLALAVAGPQELIEESYTGRNSDRGRLAGALLDTTLARKDTADGAGYDNAAVPCDGSPARVGHENLTCQLPVECSELPESNDTEVMEHIVLLNETCLSYENDCKAAAYAHEVIGAQQKVAEDKIRELQEQISKMDEEWSKTMLNLREINKSISVFRDDVMQMEVVSQEVRAQEGAVSKVNDTSAKRALWAFTPAPNITNISHLLKPSEGAGPNATAQGTGNSSSRERGVTNVSNGTVVNRTAAYGTTANATVQGRAANGTIANATVEGRAANGKTANATVEGTATNSTTANATAANATVADSIVSTVAPQLGTSSTANAEETAHATTIMITPGPVITKASSAVDAAATSAMDASDDQENPQMEGATATIEAPSIVQSDVQAKTVPNPGDVLRGTQRITSTNTNQVQSNPAALEFQNVRTSMTAPTGAQSQAMGTAVPAVLEVPSISAEVADTIAALDSSQAADKS